MSISTEIARIEQAKTDIAAAIEEKGVEVGEEKLDAFAALIAQITGGGGEAVLPDFLVDLGLHHVDSATITADLDTSKFSDADLAGFAVSFDPVPSSGEQVFRDAAIFLAFPSEKWDPESEEQDWFAQQYQYMGPFREGVFSYNLYHKGHLNWYLDGAGLFNGLQAHVFAILNRPIKASAGGGGEDFEITDASYLFYQGSRTDCVEQLLKHVKTPTTCAYMFYKAGAGAGTPAKQLDLSGVDFSKCESFYNMFYNCSLFDSIVLNMPAATCNNLFNSCQAKEIHINIIASTEPASLQSLFFCSTLLQTIDISTESETLKVSDLSSVFAYCDVLENLTVPKLSVPDKGLSMAALFMSCKKLKAVDLSCIPIDKATDTMSMFSACESFRSLDFTGHQLSLATDISMMFNGCKNLEEIINFSAPTATSGNQVFPKGSTMIATPYALQRLTFIGNLQVDIDVQYCSFARQGAVEMFNSLPTVTSPRKITLTGNPCCKDGSLAAADIAIATEKGWTVVTA